MSSPTAAVGDTHAHAHTHKERRGSNVCIYTYIHTHTHASYIHTYSGAEKFITHQNTRRQRKKCQQTFRGCRDKQIYWITSAHALHASFLLVPALRKRICLSCARKRGREGARDEVRTSLRDNARSHKTRVWLKTCGIGLQCTLEISQPELFVPFLLDPIRTRRHLKDISSSLPQSLERKKNKKTFFVWARAARRLHRHSYIGFILAFASSIHNKQLRF
jgi:hypothetical protein